MLITIPSIPAFVDKEELYWQIAFNVKMLLCYYLFKLMKNPKNIRKMPTLFQKTINDIGDQIGSQLQSNLEEITQERIKVFGSADILEIQSLMSSKLTKKRA